MLIVHSEKETYLDFLFTLLLYAIIWKKGIVFKKKLGKMWKNKAKILFFRQFHGILEKVNQFEPLNNQEKRYNLMDKKVDQKIELGYGVDFRKLVEDIRRLTEEKNKEGYELTDVSTQINNGKTTMSSLAVLVYTKK